MYIIVTDGWEFTSHCVRLVTLTESPDCQSNGVLYPDRCVGSNDDFDASQRDDVLSGRVESFIVDCGCYEVNCTAEMAEIKFEFSESPPNPPENNETTPTCEDNETTPTCEFNLHTYMHVCAIP